jgi:hypothetical protein
MKTRGVIPWDDEIQLAVGAEDSIFNQVLPLRLNCSKNHFRRG